VPTLRQPSSPTLGRGYRQCAFVRTVDMLGLPWTLPRPASQAGRKHLCPVNLEQARGISQVEGADGFVPRPPSSRLGCESCGKQFSEQRRRRLCAACRNWTACGCGGRKKRASVACTECIRGLQPGAGNHNWRGGRIKHNAGYLMVHTPDRSTRYTFQHILVMEEVIGRRLVPGETVHHLNGIRDDNRPENLELWTRPPRAGIRVVDSVRHAVETLRRYAPHLLA
jgi:hypothetical protein